MAEGLVRGEDGVVRCSWGASHPDYVRYNDEEWGFPVADDRCLFEQSRFVSVVVSAAGPGPSARCSSRRSRSRCSPTC